MYLLLILFLWLNFDWYGPHICECLVAQSCPALWDPMDCNLPGSSIHGIFRARILEWVAVPSSRVSFRRRDWTCFSCLLHWQAGSLPFELQGKPKTGFSPLDHQGSPYCLNVASPNWVKIQNSHWISKINMKITNETSIKSTYYLFHYLDIILNESKSAPCLKLATKTLRMDCYS